MRAEWLLRVYNQTLHGRVVDSRGVVRQKRSYGVKNTTKSLRSAFCPQTSEDSGACIGVIWRAFRVPLLTVCGEWIAVFHLSKVRLTLTVSRIRLITRFLTQSRGARTAGSTSSTQQVCFPHQPEVVVLLLEKAKETALPCVLNAINRMRAS